MALPLDQVAGQSFTPEVLPEYIVSLVFSQTGHIISAREATHIIAIVKNNLCHRCTWRMLVQTQDD